MNSAISDRCGTIANRNAGNKSRKSLACVALSAITAMFPRPATAQAGALDATFGKEGIFSLSASSALVTSVAIQSDGKILAAGMIENFPAVLRLNTNGTVDSTFGNGGVVTATFGNQAVGDQAVAIAVQPDGRIVMAATDALADNGGLGFELARFNTNGSSDTSFGNGGVLNLFPLNQAAIGSNLIGPSAMALQPDGKILVAGSGVMVRLETSGQLDSTFGMSGAAVLVSPSVTALALLSDGRILIASEGAPFLENFSTAGSITGYNSNGSLDASFGSSGQSSCLVSGTAILVQPTGKIVVAGSLVSQLEIPPVSNQTGFGLVRLNPNGSLDTTFGVHGAATTGFSPADSSATATALVQQISGDVIALGLAGQAQSTNQPVASSMALSRYSAAGKLDPTFGSAGKTTTGFGSTAATVVATAVQSDGKIVAVGNGATPFTVVRYLGQ